jgi:uncharacterized membrane protein required for colicin V production
VIAALAGLRYYTYIDSYVLAQFDVSPKIAPMISGGIIFAVVFFIFNFLLGGLSNAVNNGKAGAFLPSVDKTLGVIWGALKFSVIISIATMLLGAVNLPPESMTSGSFLYPRIGMDVFNATFANIPLAQKLLGEVEKTIGISTTQPPAIENSPTAPPQQPTIYMPSQDVPKITADNDRSADNRRTTTLPPTPSTDRVVRVDKLYDQNPHYKYPQLAPEQDPSKTKPATTKPKNRPSGTIKPPTIR